MKATIDRKAFSNAMSRINKVTLSKSPKKALQCCQVALNGRLTIATTDLEIFLIEDIPVADCSYSHEDTAIVTVNVADFKRLAATENEKRIPISISDNEVGLGSGTIATYSGGDYPTLKLPGDKTQAKGSLAIVASELAKILAYCLPATDQQSTRFALGGILLENHAGALRAVATDGRRLHEANNGPGLPVDATADCSALVPAKAIEVAISAAKTADSCHLYFYENDIVFEFFSRGDRTTIIRSRVVEGRFPNWSKCFVFDRPADTKVRIRAELLFAATNSATKFFGPQNKKSPDWLYQTRYALANGQLKVIARNQETGEKLEKLIPVAYGQLDGDYVFDCRYFVHASDNLGDSLIDLRFGKPDEPLYFFVDTSKVRFQAIIMPMSK